MMYNYQINQIKTNQLFRIVKYHKTNGTTNYINMTRKETKE